MNDANARQEQTSGQPEPQASGVETTGGQPAEASPASDAGPIVFDPTKQYQFGEGDNKVSLLGAEIQNAIGRAALAQREQSRADQATSRAEQLEQAYGEGQSKIAELEATLAGIQQREQISQQIREQMPTASRQSSPAGEDFWSTESTTQPPVQIDPEQMAQRVTDIAKQTVEQATQQQFGNVEEMVGNIVAKVMKQQNEQRAMQENAQRWATDQFEERKQRYITEHGFEPAEADTVAKMFDAQALHEDAGRQAAAQGDFQTATQHYNEAKRFATAGTERLAKQMVKHEEQQVIEEMQSQVESGQFDNLPVQADDGPDLSGPNEFWKPENKGAFRKWKEGLKTRNIARAEQMNTATAALNAAHEKLKASR
jgi:hypothetical protein